MPSALTKFEFPHPVMCRPELLGTRSKISLPRLEAEFCLPIETERRLGHEAPFAAPRVRGIKYLEEQLDGLEDEVSAIYRWGEYWSGGTRAEHWVGRLHAGVLRVRIAAATKAKVHDAADDLHVGMFSWWETFRDWVEVLTGQDLDHRHPVEQFRFRAPGETLLWTFRDEQTGSDDYFGYTPPIEASPPDGEPLDRTSWNTAMRQANRGVSPPDAHLLLRDSRAAARRGARRTCVLHAATAVEMTLTPLLNERISASVGPRAAETLLPQRQPISTKIDVLASLGVSLTASLHRDVFTTRNRVAHSGYTPTEEEARSALDAASNVVARHTPLTDRRHLT